MNGTETISDIDGNVYSTIRIGKQVWTVENLRTTRYTDGTKIPWVIQGSQWKRLSTPAFCYYNNRDNHKNKYGALYNWHAVRGGRIAPEGWHVPHPREWDELETYLTNSDYNLDRERKRREIAKSLAATTDWESNPLENAVGWELILNNRTGFTALPGGYRLDDGKFLGYGTVCCFWDSMGIDELDARLHSLLSGECWLNCQYRRKKFGASVRLLRD